MAARTLTCLAFCAQHAYAHVDARLAMPRWWMSWSGEWWLWLLIGASGWLYARGVRRLWQAAAPDAGIARWQAACFTAGWLTLVVALLSPLDALGSLLFSVHMVQHELLMIVAAPLLVVGRPLAPWIWALPPAWRKPAADICRRTGLQPAVGWLTRPFVASIVSVLALWAWHIPALFGAALRNEWIHATQHACFFVSSLLFWWALFARRSARSSYPGIFYVFAAGVQSSLLGALLTFAAAPWYDTYVGTASALGLSSLEDQQLGGLIMWIPGGLVYLAIALALLGAWIRAADRVASRAG